MARVREITGMAEHNQGWWNHEKPELVEQLDMAVVDGIWLNNQSQ